MEIISYKTLESTNKFALQNINNFESDAVVRAEVQTSGRGRFNRKWISDKKNNCYISFVLKPDILFRENFPNLTQYLSVVLCDLLSEYGVLPTIKWPNDVQVNGKKICGILSEVAFEKSSFKGIVLGIGVNLNLSNTNLESIDIPATSLNLELNKEIDSNVFIEKLVTKFSENYNNILEKGFSEVRAKYISYCNFLGKEITIKNPEPIALGIATCICEDGALEVLTSSGETKKIISGDVIV